MTATTYADPYSGQEFLLLETPTGEVVGVTYDPRKPAEPVAWRSSCPHCRSGKTHLLTIHAKREIQLLVSRRSTADSSHYVVPTNTTPLDLVVTETPEQRTIVVSSPDHVLVVKARPPWKSLEYEGDRRQFQAPILHRSVKLLMSARPTPPQEVCSCLSSLLAPRPSPRGRPLPCKKIDWATVLGHGGAR
jgi:hypothetical protein